MPKRSKRYREMFEQVKGKGPFPLDEAVSILKGFKPAKYEQSVEASMHLGIDPRQADQMLRGAISLPAGTGKTVRLAVFAKGDNETKAKEAGADYVGAEELAQKIKDGWLDFDMTLATPDMMGLVGPLGRVLGPRGLMPTPKNGTVTADIATAVSEFKGGKIEYRSDSSGNVHALVGKMNFTEQQLKDNISTFVNHIRSSRPASVKGTYIHSVTICGTMTPGIPVVV